MQRMRYETWDAAKSTQKVSKPSQVCSSLIIIFTLAIPMADAQEATGNDGAVDLANVAALSNQAPAPAEGGQVGRDLEI